MSDFKTLFDRKGKFAPYWLAAGNEKLFKKHYRKTAIEKLNVAETCDEIIKIMQDKSKATKFDLNSLSQLMNGITKVHSYQTEYYDKEMFQSIQKSLESNKSLKDLNEDSDAMKIPDLPEDKFILSSSKFSNQIYSDLHILPGEQISDKLQMKMKDATCVDFGALTDEELNFWLEYNINDKTMEKMHNEMIDITDTNKQQDLTDVEMTDVEIMDNVQREVQSPQSSSVLVDISKTNKSKEKLLLTPQKRHTYQQVVETPTKRKRLQFEDHSIDMIPVPLNDVPMLSPYLPMQETSLVPQVALSTEDVLRTAPSNLPVDMELAPVELEPDSTVIKKKQIIDKNIILKNTTLQQWRQNIHTRTKAVVNKPQIPAPISASINLKRPSHMPMLWSSSLQSLFVKHITGLFRKADEDVSYMITQSQEQIREQRTVQYNTGITQTMSKLLETDKQIATDEICSVAMENLSITDKMSNQEMKMDISSSDSLIDINVFLKEKWGLKQTSLLSPICSIQESQDEHKSLTILTSQDIMALLEVLWHDQPYVKFESLISKETYSRKDASDAFYLLLALHEQKKLVLQQSEFYHTLWIRKYEV